MKLRRIAVAAAALLMLSSCAQSPGQTSGTVKTTDFTVAVFQSELYLPDYVAQDTGIAAKHGLNMKFVTPSNGPAAAQFMLAGTVNGWTTDPLIVLAAAGQGQDIKMAGMVAPVLNYSVLVKDGGTWPADNAPVEEKIKALAGKNIGVSGIGAGTDHALIALLESAGMTADQVTRIGIGQQQAAIGQLQTGRIDAFVSLSLSGNETITQKAGARLYLSTHDESVSAAVRAIPHAVFAVSGKYAEKNPETVANWIAAEKESLTWIKENPDKAAEILNKHVFNGEQLDLAKTVVPKMLTTYFSDTPADMKITETAFGSALKAAKAQNVVPASKELTFNDVVISSARGGQ